MNKLIENDYDVNELNENDLDMNELNENDQEVNESNEMIALNQRESNLLWCQCFLERCNPYCFT